MTEQQEIVRQVEGLFALADQLEERLAKARGQVEKLTPSLPPSPGYGGTGLARAFSGQLVPQDPTDEPAEKLLERIKAHHESKSQRDVGTGFARQGKNPGASVASVVDIANP